MRSGRAIVVALVACLAAVTAVAPAHAQVGTSLDQRYRQALETMLSDLADPEKSFEFAQLAVEIGDLRGAIAAFERMLLINPRLGNIELELGVLYLRTGNAVLARYHISEALRAPNVPIPVRARAERYLAIAGSESTRNFFHGELSVGYRYDSDANSGPDSPFVTVYDPFLGQAVSAKLSGSAQKRSDYLTQLLGHLSHSYAFSGGAGSSWDTTLAASGAFYKSLTNLNQWSLNLDTGPTVALGPDPDAPFQIRPYATGAYSQLDGYSYLQGAGGGLILRKIYESRSATSLQLQYLHQEFKDLPGILLNDRTGNYYSADFSQLWQVGRWQWGLYLSGARNGAVAEYQSFDNYGGGLSARVLIGGNGSKPPWSIAVNADRREYHYSSPDPLIDPGMKRTDGRSDAGLVIDVPLTRYFSINLAANYVKNDSNLPNFEYKDSGGNVSFVARF